MKKISVLFLAIAASFALVSCEREDHAENLQVEYYASFELIGGSPYILPIGTAWTDPGIVATANGMDVASELKIDDPVDDKTIGSYTVTYTYTNPSGFTSSINRTVYVCNPEVTTDISGTYTTQKGTYRVSGGNETPYAGFKVKITKICPGFFEIDDMLAQYYNEYVGYGPKYNYAYDFSAEGNMSLNLDNTIDFVGGGYVGAWGDYSEGFTNGLYDPETQTVSFVTTYAGMEFHVVMKKD